MGQAIVPAAGFQPASPCRNTAAARIGCPTITHRESAFIDQLIAAAVHVRRVVSDCATSGATTTVPANRIDPMAAPIPQVTLEQFNTRYRHLHLLHAAVDYWAAQNPAEAVVINATRGTQLTWSELQQGSMALAAGAE